MLFVVIEMKQIGMEEATMSAYFVALCRMHRDRRLPSRWRTKVLEHMYQVAVMAGNWDWDTCRQWSETVCAMSAHGRLSKGWHDTHAVKDVQRDVCALGTMLEQNKPGKVKSSASDVE